MKALLLDGSRDQDPIGERIRVALTSELEQRGWQVEHVLLRVRRIGNCAGDFFCWVRSPGVCNANDDNRAIAAAIIQSDLTVYLTPVTFGGYSMELKRMVDHQIQLISPFFINIDGETHHQRRYERYPDLLAVGWMDAPVVAAEAIFRQLAHRNAINMHSAAAVCDVVTGDPTTAELESRSRGWLNAVANGKRSTPPALPDTSISFAASAPVQRAVLLVGSPRTSKSNSAALGSYLMEQLAARGVATETIQIYTTFNAPQRRNVALTAIDAADLVVLAFPLYVDSLPAPVIAALETIAARGAPGERRQRFTAIANCGFPESAHNATALAICAQFARETGRDWMGGLALGGGEGVIHGRSLHDIDGRAQPVRKALELAAAALAQGHPVPPPARDLMGRTIIPGWMYTLVGSFGWRRWARRYGVQNAIRRRPYAAQ